MVLSHGGSPDKVGFVCVYWKLASNKCFPIARATGYTVTRRLPTNSVTTSRIKQPSYKQKPAATKWNITDSHWTVFWNVASGTPKWTLSSPLKCFWIGLISSDCICFTSIDVIFSSYAKALLWCYPLQNYAASGFEFGSGLFWGLLTLRIHNLPSSKRSFIWLWLLCFVYSCIFWLVSNQFFHKLSSSVIYLVAYLLCSYLSEVYATLYIFNMYVSCHSGILLLHV